MSLLVPTVTCYASMQADVSNDDIKMQGVSLTELLSKYFLHRSSRLLPEAYWRDFRGFDIKLHVSIILTSQCQKTKGLLHCMAASSMHGLVARNNCIPKPWCLIAGPVSCHTWLQ